MINGVPTQARSHLSKRESWCGRLWIGCLNSASLMCLHLSRVVKFGFFSLVWPERICWFDLAAGTMGFVTIGDHSFLGQPIP